MKSVMISLSHLNKIILFVIFLIILTFNPVLGEDEPVDIWEKKENQNEEDNETDQEKDITIESPIISDDIKKIVIKIDENTIIGQNQSVIGIFDPEENNFNLNNYDIEYYKGDYYKSNIKNLNCLIYPLPKKVSLGLHTVLSLNGDVSFGPNYYKVNNVDYSIDNKHESEYLAGFKQLLDDNDLKLTPDFSGIRPKIKNNGRFNDFIIKNEKDQGFNNFINLIGIDSPGLTSSLSIAKYVESLINY